MRSTHAVLAALASTGALAQPHGHGHGHAHQHPARLAHQHHHEKRVLETEVVIEWVYETVLEMIEGTTTEWTTLLPSTTFATSVIPSSGGDFHEISYSTSSPSVAPSAPPPPQSTTTSAAQTYVPPAPQPITSSSSSSSTTPSTTPVYEPSTPSDTPVVVVPTPTTTYTPPAATPTTSSSSGSTGGDTGWKITWIGDTTGALSACGQPYEADSMFVAVNPGVLDCGADGKGTPMSVTANGKTVSAFAIDKCMGCDTSHIDVATAVYEALGFTLTDGGMHNTGHIDWVIS